MFRCFHVSMPLKKEILLSYFPKITHARCRHLIRAFGSLDAAWKAEWNDMKSLAWEENLVHEFLLWRDELDEARIEQELTDERITCAIIGDPSYPRLLKEIYDPPFCLFIRGTLDNADCSLAVVGSRKHSPYGQQATEMLIAPIAQAGIPIVSGLAIGIDSVAHQTALRHGGPTIAVLGGGVDDQHIAPRAHLPLAHEIIKRHGAVISEYPPGMMPTAYTFPARNRIIAGMTIGTLVIEAAEGSGALITAQCALDSNREVFAVPQNITSETSAGVNHLIKTGAKPVLSADDIFEALNLRDIKQYGTNNDIVPDSPEEAKILPFLSKEPAHIDTIAKNAVLPTSAISSALTLMEMKGKVKNLGGMMYVRAR